MKNTEGTVGTHTTEKITTPDGKLIARLMTNIETQRVLAYDKLNNFKGTYNPRTNVTRDNHGRVVSRGNTLVAVVLNAICAKGVGAVCHPVAVIKS